MSAQKWYNYQTKGGERMKDNRIYLRIETGLKEKLQELAAAENRTLSNYIIDLLKKQADK